MTDQTTSQSIIIRGPLTDISRTSRRDIIDNAVDVSVVRKHFENFLENLRSIIDVKVPSVGEFELDEVQFSAEISADGDFKLMGVGVGVEATSGVTFTLKRKPKPASG